MRLRVTGRRTPARKIVMADERLRIIDEMRSLGEQFITGEVTFDQFYPKFSRLLGYFDPMDWETEDLPAPLKSEVEFYSGLMGCDFGEREAEQVMPLATDWTYGVSRDPYGWIDKEEYRRQFAARLHEFRRTQV